MDPAADNVLWTCRSTLVSANKTHVGVYKSNKETCLGFQNSIKSKSREFCLENRSVFLKILLYPGIVRASMTFCKMAFKLRVGTFVTKHADYSGSHHTSLHGPYLVESIFRSRQRGIQVNCWSSDFILLTELVCLFLFRVSWRSNY